MKCSSLQFKEAKSENKETKEEMKCEAPKNIKKVQEDNSLTSVDPEHMCKRANKDLHEIRTLKWQNRIWEQQKKVVNLKETCGSYRDTSRLYGITLKTVHSRGLQYKYGLIHYMQPVVLLLLLPSLVLFLLLVSVPSRLLVSIPCLVG